MRYDRKAIFVTEGKAIYDPVSGTHQDAAQTEIVKYCSVHDLGTERAVTLFGRADFRGLVFSHQGKRQTADFVQIGCQKYAIKISRKLGNKASYIVEELKA